MPRTKHGRAVAKAVTRQEIEQELANVCDQAKKHSGNIKTYGQYHDWLDDLLSQWEFVRQMNGPQR